MSRRFLFVNADYTGHLLPTLALTAGLVGDGHRVTYVVPEGFAGAAADAGAETVPYQARLGETNPFDSFESFAAVDSDEALTGWLDTYFRRFVDDVGSIVDAGRSRFRDDDPPDVVVYDQSVACAGRELAGGWGRPGAAMSSVFLENEHFRPRQDMFGSVGTDPRLLETLPERMAAILASSGSAVSLEQLLSDPAEDLTLSHFPRFFQPAADTFDERFVFAGPSSAGRRHEAGWTAPADDLPLALVSGSTLPTRAAGLFRETAEAFDGVPWHVVMALGAVDPAELGPLPPNVEAHRWVPHGPVLERASVSVTHGGLGGIMDALRAGRPMVVVPPSRMYRSYADRVAELGVGRVLEPADFTGERLRDTVLEVAEDEATTSRVAGFSRQIRDGDAVREATAALEAHADRSGPPG